MTVVKLLTRLVILDYQFPMLSPILGVAELLTALNQATPFRFKLNEITP